MGGSGGPPNPPPPPGAPTPRAERRRLLEKEPPPPAPPPRAAPAPREQPGEPAGPAAPAPQEQVLPEKVARIWDDVLEEAANLPFGVGNERPQVLARCEREAEEPPAVVRVAPAQRDGRFLQHEDARGALLARGDGRSKRRVAG